MDMQKMLDQEKVVNLIVGESYQMDGIDRVRKIQTRFPNLDREAAEVLLDKVVEIRRTKFNLESILHYLNKGEVGEAKAIATRLILEIDSNWS